MDEMRDAIEEKWDAKVAALVAQPSTTNCPRALAAFPSREYLCPGGFPSECERAARQDEAPVFPALSA